MTGDWRRVHNEELNGFVLLTQYCKSDQTENNIMGSSCSTNGGEVYTGFWWGNLSERDHLEDRGIDKRIILRWLFRKWNVGAWTGRDRQQALVNVVINLGAPQNAGTF